MVGVGAGGWSYAWRRFAPARRAWLARRVRAGAAAGFPALLAYDGARYGLVSLATLSFEPFHALPLFGRAILGAATPELPATLVGTGYHVANGLSFAVAFTILVARPSVIKGIAWALVLECAMLLLYPGWLGLSVAGELLPVSVAGHLAFGSVLGFGSARMLR